jgi:hypothetical protein
MTTDISTAVGAWECPPTTSVITTTYPIRFNESGVIVCMTLDGKTCITNLTPEQCAAYATNPVQTIPACNATQLRTPSNTFCYRAAQALLPDYFGDCKYLWLPNCACQFCTPSHSCLNALR